MHETATNSLVEGLFEEQRGFVLDDSPRVAALCPRRAGKSYSCCVRLLKTALETEFSTAVYITLTLQQATQNIWNLLKQFNQQYGLELKFNETKKEVMCPNGSTIRLVGAADRGAGEKLRGGAYALVVIDEAKSFRPAVLEELILDVLEPALYDYVSPEGVPGGTLAMIGTPGSVLCGPFYNATRADHERDESWSYHFWTTEDNVAKPWIWQGMLQNQFPNGIEDATPKQRREYLGEWVPSTELAVFGYDEEVDGEELPDGHSWTHLLGVFLGLDGEVALVVTAYSDTHPELHPVWSHAETGLSLTESAKLIKATTKTYEPELTKVHTTEFNRALTSRLNMQYNLDLSPSDTEQDIYSLVELVNTDFRDGVIKMPKKSPLAEEMRLLQWDTEEKRRWNPDLSSGCCLAFLHTWNEAQHRFHTPKAEPLTQKQLFIEREQQSLERMANRRNGTQLYGEDVLDVLDDLSFDI